MFSLTWFKFNVSGSGRNVRTLIRGPRLKFTSRLCLEIITNLPLAVCLTVLLLRVNTGRKPGRVTICRNCRLLLTLFALFAFRRTLRLSRFGRLTVLRRFGQIVFGVITLLLMERFPLLFRIFNRLIGPCHSRFTFRCRRLRWVIPIKIPTRRFIMVCGVISRCRVMFRLTLTQSVLFPVIMILRAAQLMVSTLMPITPVLFIIFILVPSVFPYGLTVQRFRVALLTIPGRVQILVLTGPWARTLRERSNLV